jgi:methyl-accepting chemotaxis protein
MSAERPKNARKSYLINPAFQWRFVTFMLAIALVTILVFYAANLYFFLNFIGIGRELNLPPDHALFRFIAEQRRTMNIIFVATSFVAGIVIVGGGILLSHRVAGPLHRLRGHLDRVAESGDAKPVIFRKGDFFPELAEACNRCLDRLKSSRPS